MMNITVAEGLEKSSQGDSDTSPGRAGQRLLLGKNWVNVRMKAIRFYITMEERREYEALSNAPNRILYRERNNTKNRVELFEDRGA